MPRGGRRPGAGRKPRNRTPEPEGLRLLTHPAAVSGIPTTNARSPIEEFDAPDSLTREEREIWLKQAPFAFANRTLTRATAMSFERYCRVVVMERAESASSARGGANHRGLLKQINAYELQFILTPCGKALFDAPLPKPVQATESKLAKFRS